MSNEVSGLSLTKGILVLLFTLSGVSLKLADFYGEQDRSYLGYVAAIITAGCMGLLISDSPIASSVVLGIIIGVILAGKLDRRNLMFGLCLTLVTSVILGFDYPDLRLLAIIGVASWVDEVTHDRFASRRGMSTRLFRFRIGLKIVLIVLTVLNWVEIVYTIGFFCFDVSYDVTGVLLEKRVG